MVPVHQHKYAEELLTPVLLFDCTLADGQVERWSTHNATWQDVTYSPRVVDNSEFSIGLLADDGADWGNRITVELVNTDGYVTRLHRAENLKGCTLLVRFAFLDPESSQIASTPEAVFAGVGDAPEELTTSVGRISFISRFSLQRVALPQTRIQERCPWSFPRNAAERTEAISGGTKGTHSRFYPCGYSADGAGGCGNLDGNGSPFTTCTGSKADCVARGMWEKDNQGQATARFGGFQFLPSTSLVRSSGSSQRFWSQAVDGRARTNDAVPLVYGTARYPAPVIWAWNDGNFLICEALAGAGPIQGICRLWANGIELPLGVPGTNMSATGWYDVLTTGNRNGAFDPNFADSQGQPVSDPHGSMAIVSVHVPASLISSNSLPTIEVLAHGLVLQRYDVQGKALEPFFTSNPAWALLDMLKRCGWEDCDLDLPSFANSAASLDQTVSIPDADDLTLVEARAAFNYALLGRKPSIDVIRGLRQGAQALLRLNAQGQLSMIVEGTISSQQPMQAVHSNATSPLNNGWPSFEANDGSTGNCTILANNQGDIDLRLFCQPTSQTPNRLTVEYQDSLNDYLNGSLSLIDLDDVARAGSEIPGVFRALGIPTKSQAERALSKELARTIDGNLFAEFSTTIKGLGMQPGDIITLTSSDYELSRAPFRVLRLSPGLNFETVAVLAQTHDDGWYGPGTAVSSSSTGWPSAVNSGTPLPIAGYTYTAENGHMFDVQESSGVLADGGAKELLMVRFRPPRQQVAALSTPGIKLPATIASGGMLKPGAKALYYAATALNSAGEESRLSQIVQVVTGAVETSFSVTINGLTAPKDATGLRIYRGESAFDLLYLDNVAANLVSWTDHGDDVSPMRPPDPRYDHADFYWREELTGQLAIQSLPNGAIQVPAGGYDVDRFAGSALTVVTGTAKGWQGTVASNSDTTFNTVEPLPDGLAAGDEIAIADESWRLAGRSYGDQITWEAPNSAGLTLQIMGRSCTASGLEAPAEQSFLSRYTLIGGSGSLMDSRVPPPPESILEAPADGTLVLRNLTTETLTGTNTISEAILATYSNDETSPAMSFALSASLAPDSLTLPLADVSSLPTNTYVQIDVEIICVNEVTKDGTARWINRGIAGSTATAHSAGAAGVILERVLHTVPLGAGFFANPAHTDFQYKFLFPNRRVAGAELYLSNARGTGPGQEICYLGNGSSGLRTFEGAAFILQASGVLSVERDAANSVSTDRVRIVRDIQARVDSAPSGGSITVEVKANGNPVATLTVSEGTIESKAFCPPGTLALAEGTKLNLDITSVPQGLNTFSGKNLSVQIRT
jgi:hypothetical protein